MPIRKPPRQTVYISWTPALIKSAEVVADNGDLRLAADLCEWAMRDSRVRGVLGARVSGLLGLDLDLEALPGGEQAAIDLAEQWDVQHDHRELVRLSSWGIMLGVGLAHVDYVKGADGKIHKSIKAWSPRWLRYDQEKDAWFVKVDNEGTEVEIIPDDGEWIVYTPYGSNRPWSLAPWHDIGVLVLLKKYCTDDFGRHSEVHGTPIRSGEAPVGASEEDRTAMANDLNNIGADSSYVPPGGWKAFLLEATARTFEMFFTGIEFANLEISISLAGANLSSEVTAGSLAAAKVHGDIRADLIRDDAKALSLCLREQSLKPWCLYKYGDAELAPKVCWDTEPPEDEKAIGDGLTALGNGIKSINEAVAGYNKKVKLCVLDGIVELEDLNAQNNAQNALQNNNTKNFRVRVTRKVQGILRKKPRIKAAQA